MKRTLTAAVLVLVLAVAGLQRAGAVSFSPVPEEEAKGLREKGEVICLFQSGTWEIRKAIAIGDELSVFRQEKNGPLREVGKIRVLSYVGDDFLKAEVVEGELRAGDVARKGDVASLVISSEDRCR